MGGTAAKLSAATKNGFAGHMLYPYVTDQDCSNTSLGARSRFGQIHLPSEWTCQFSLGTVQSLSCLENMEALGSQIILSVLLCSLLGHQVAGATVQGIYVL